MPKLNLAALFAGSIGGAGIWIAAGLTELTWPAWLFVWPLAGLIAALIAICIVRCMVLHPVSSPYAHVTAAFGHFYGFMTGWTILLAEIVILSLFATAFSIYLSVFIPLTGLAVTFAKAVFILGLTAAAAVIGTRWAKIDRAAAMIRLGLLGFFIIAGLALLAARPEVLITDISLEIASLLPALVLVLWAFSGLEIAIFPAMRERDGVRSVLLALAVLTGIYFVMNLLAHSAGSGALPLIAAGQSIFAAAGLGQAGMALAALAALAALVCPRTARITGTARLSLAMAADGMLSASFVKFCRNQPRSTWLFAVCAIALSFFDIIWLIHMAMFCLAVTFIALCLAYLRLRRYYLRVPYARLPLDPAAIVALLVLLALLSQIAISPALVAIIIVLLGIPFYIHLSPKTEIRRIKDKILSRRYILASCREAQGTYLGPLLLALKRR
jgi:amino acid transporter